MLNEEGSDKEIIGLGDSKSVNILFSGLGFENRSEESKK